MFGRKSKSKGEGSSQYRGVEKRPNDKYTARTYGVEEKGKRSSLGTFDTAEEAAMAYDYANRSMHGTNAYTNFVYPDGKHRGSLTNITAPYEPEYDLSPDHHPAAAANQQVNYPQNSGFGQVDYPPWVPGDDLPPLPGSSYSGGYGNGNGNRNGWY